MRIFTIILFSFFLISCDGFDIDSVDNPSGSSDKRFSRSELSFNVIFSSLLLNDTGFGSRDGFIALFNSSAELEEIELNSNGNALFGRYPWTIANDKLQVTYPNGVTCTSTKSAETSSQYTASSTCSGGQPNNDPIRNTLVKAVTFDKDDVSGKSITIDNNNDDVRIEFFENDNFEIRNLDSNGEESSTIAEKGTYDDSSFSNVIRLDNTELDQYRLWILLDGSLASGTLIELRYSKSTDNSPDTLNKVFIYTINANDRWETESLYDDIDIDG